MAFAFKRATAPGVKEFNMVASKGALMYSVRPIHVCGVLCVGVVPARISARVHLRLFSHSENRRPTT